MLTAFPDPDYDRYRLVLVEPSAKNVLAKQENAQWKLPRISIPRWTRPAERILSEIESEFGIQAIILDELPAMCSDAVLVAEMIGAPKRVLDSSFSWRSLDDIYPGQFLGSEVQVVQTLLLDGATGRGPFSRLGWINEVLSWVAAETGEDPSQFASIKQVNASCNATLMRIETTTGSPLWFKAVHDPQIAEYRLTGTLRDLFPVYLPTLLATHDRWHAWLMEDAGRPLDEMENIRPRLLEGVAHHLAELQKASERAVPTLLDRGFADHRLSSLCNSMPEIMACLEEAVAIPDFGRPAHLSQARVRALYREFQEAASRLGASNVPDTLVHNDINTGNILIADGTCIFTDWAQAGVGNPFANFEQLRIQVVQNQGMALSRGRLLAAYERSWSTRVASSQLQRAFTVVPPVAIAMYLHSRRDWFNSERLREPNFVGYARSMARQMDRAVREIQMREALTA